MAGEWLKHDKQLEVKEHLSLVTIYSGKTFETTQQLKFDLMNF